MNGQGASGYGIVPVPLYRTNYTDADTGETKVDNYLTHIYNIGKIGAISYTTEKFAECTAYLNYQSTHSTDILNEYFDHKHQYDVTDAGVKGNVEMLKYIRGNVRSSFDVTFDDLMRNYFYLIENMHDVEDYCRQWYIFIKNNNYQINNMDGYYNVYARTKAWRIYNIENTVYPTLPD